MEQTKTRPTPRPQTGTPKAKKAPPKSTPPQKRSRLTESEKRGAQTLMAILFVAVVLYLLIVLIIAVFVWYSFSTPAESETLYSLRIITEDGNIKRASYSATEANNSYGLYLRYSDVAPLCGFGIAGDEETVTLYLPGGGLVNSTQLECIVLHRNSSCSARYNDDLTAKIKHSIYLPAYISIASDANSAVPSPLLSIFFLKRSSATYILPSPARISSVQV